MKCQDIVVCDTNETKREDNGVVSQRAALKVFLCDTLQCHTATTFASVGTRKRKGCREEENENPMKNNTTAAQEQK